MAKIWFSELWEPKEVDLTKTEIYYGQSETKSFFDYDDPNKGDEIRGIRPPCRETQDSKVIPIKILP